MFQKKIVEHYLSFLDKKILQEKYSQFSKTFLDKTKQANIRSSKEEQYQEGFLRDLFCQILGYIIKPEKNFNLFTEAKNDVRNKSNSKKADGAICEANNENNIKCVIELKSTQTKDLDNVAFQAFSYKNFHSDCKYIIVSNFERLRFYVEVQSDFIEFNLFDLDFEHFCVLYLLLESNQMFNDIPLKIKNESISAEKQITDEFYSVYSDFKRNLFEDLKENNPEIDKLLLFKKTQKLLDRILFIRFCSDRGLLPANSILNIIKRWKTSKENFIDVPLYSLFKQYFNWIDKGFENPKDSNNSIFAYNGGLFKTDDILDNVKISDDVLFVHCEKLCQYDFESQISVDILGRIFENSLTEIEEVEKEIEAEKTGAKIQSDNKGKRKKDGVFYTPEYITNYIAQNTIGVLCENRRKELEINGDVYNTEKKYTKKQVLDLEAKLTDYRNWLFGLKILDLACGSGAFLNAALKQLRKEHNMIDTYFNAIHKEKSLNFETIENDNSILENNLYGVDINEDSIEITKLSLWLNTAKRNRKLTTLTGKIKCGNSLIDSPDFEKAFDWKKEFEEVFEKGGFDVVISNPPYVPSRSISEKEKEFYYKKFKTAKYQINTYALFVERIFDLLKPNGIYGYIIPNYWLSTKFDKVLRQIVFCNHQANSVLNTYSVFEDAVVDTLIIIGKNSQVNHTTKILSIDRNCKTIAERLEKIGAKKWSYEDEKLFSEKDEDVQISFSKQIELKGEKCLSDYFSFYQGMKPYEQGKGIPPQTKEMMKARIYNSETKIDESYLPLLGAANIQRYFIRPNKEFIKYGKNLAAPRKFEIFNGQRILVNRIISKENLDCCYIDYTAINNTDVFNLIPKNNCPIKLLFAILASRLCAFYLKSKNVNLDRAVFPKINVNTLENFPVPNFSLLAPDSSLLTSLADKMLSLNSDLHKKTTHFIERIKEEYNLNKITQNIEDFYKLSFADFAKELSKQKVKLTLKQKDELQDYFYDYAKEISALEEEIKLTDSKIDSLVYKLYGLTDEEIAVVENSGK